MNSEYTSHKPPKLGEHNFQQKAGNIKPCASNKKNPNKQANKIHNIVRNEKKLTSCKLIFYIEKHLRSLARLPKGHDCQDSSASGFEVNFSSGWKAERETPPPCPAVSSSPQKVINTHIILL